MRRSIVLATIVAGAFAGSARTPTEAATDAGRGSPDVVARSAPPCRAPELPCDFETNLGQTAPEVDHLVRCKGYVAFLTDGDAVIRTGAEALRLSLVGRRDVEPTASEPRPGRSHYLVGNEESRWVRDVPRVGRVAYEDALPGVDLVWRTERRELAFDVVVAPGVDGSKLRFRCDGAEWARPDAAGTLSMGLPSGGTARLSAPRAWQGEGAARRDVAVSFAAGAAKDEFGFDVGPHDPALPLVIDPSLTVSTYLGGSMTEEATAIRTDATGAIYLAGYTYSTNFPVTTGAFQTAKGETSTALFDAFVAKFDFSGKTLAFATYLGGSSNDQASGLAVDTSGAVFVGGGTSSTNFPLQSAYQTSAAGGFLAKLNAGGASLAWSTYYAYPPSVLGLDSSGNVHSFNSQGRAYVFNSSGTSLVYSVLIGGTSPPTIGWRSAMAVDPSGTVWLGGYVGSGGGSQSGALQPSFGGGGSDCWLVKLNTSGSEVYRTYLGGSGNDEIQSLALDSSGNVLITGTTTSTNFPLANAFQTSNANGGDVFVAKTNSTATALTFSTYLGGSDVDWATGIVANSNGDVFVSGYTASSNFPVQDAQQGAYAGNIDAFLAEFTSSGSRTRSTYLGGSTGQDVAYGVAVGALGAPVIAGSSQSSNFPTVAPYQPTLLGSMDCTVAGVTVNTGTFTDLSPVTVPGATVSQPYSTQLTIPGGTAPLTWTLHAGTLPAGLSVSSAGVLSGTPTATGSASLHVKVIDATGGGAIREYRVTVNPLPNVPNSTLAAWTQGRPYSKAIPFTGGSAPFLWAQTSGTVPPGTSVSNDGFLAGTPTTASSYSFAATILDGQGASSAGTISVQINPVPQITTSLPEWTQFRPYRQTLVASGGTAPFTWTLLSGALPIDKPLAPSGLLDGTMLLPGNYTFTVGVVDAAGATAQRAYTVKVNAIPSMTSAALPIAAVDRPFDAGIASADGTLPFAWSITSGTIPAGIGYSIATGRLSGTPTQSGRGVVGFQITDAAGAVGKRSYALVVAPRADLARSRTSESIAISTTGGTSDTARYVELLEGSLLDVSVKIKEPSGIALQLILLDASEQPLDIAAQLKVTAKSLSLKGFPVPATGRYFVVLRPSPGFDGTAKLTVAVRGVSSWKGTAPIDPAGAPIEVRFSAQPGARLAVTTAAAKKSLALPTIVGLRDAAGNELLVATELKPTRHGATLKPAVPLVGGDYVLTIASTAGGAAGDVNWAVAAKSPKGYPFALPGLAIEGP